ncbi:hypothetical protein [Xanthocytophaga agilis]|uniref:Uncharacterized protein n=1 Tax=Xanthocytophaga agilis TaxID=3048010 RepID=A0AAE3RDL1_9BACT|nr:hypothetical protein [Xanthocytophaga agilis]MDJ1505808.1 hypothetical protein [Xanthocytophaga agilis]
MIHIKYEGLRFCINNSLLTISENNSSRWNSAKPIAQENKRLLIMLGTIGIGTVVVSIFGKEKVLGWLDQAAEVKNQQSQKINKLYENKIASTTIS